MSKEPCVSAPSNRRTRARGQRLVLALVAICLVVLSGCTQAQRVPSSYDGAEDDFKAGCKDVATQDANSPEADVKIASPTTYCNCVWDEITKNVPWDTFKEINSDLSANGGPLPESFQKAYDSCDPKATSSSKGSDSSKTTTTAAKGN
ncbi:MAG: hypothetical protein U0P45_12960 [Acidimicrobiales bacterium]